MNLKLCICIWFKLIYYFFQPWVFMIIAHFLYACLLVQFLYDQDVCVCCIHWLGCGNCKNFVCILSDWFFVWSNCMFLLYALIDVFFYYFLVMNLNAELCVMIVVWYSFILNVEFCIMIVAWDSFIWLGSYIECVIFWNLWKFLLLMLVVYNMFVYLKHFCVITKLWYVMFLCLQSFVWCSIFDVYLQLCMKIVVWDSSMCLYICNVCVWHDDI